MIAFSVLMTLFVYSLRINSSIHNLFPVQRAIEFLDKMQNPNNCKRAKYVLISTGDDGENDFALQLQVLSKVILIPIININYCNLFRNFCM